MPTTKIKRRRRLIASPESIQVDPNRLECEMGSCRESGRLFMYTTWPNGETIDIVLCDKCKSQV